MRKLSTPGLALKPAELTAVVSHLSPYEQLCSAVLGFQHNLGGIALNAQLKQEVDNLRQVKAKVERLLTLEKKESDRLRLYYNKETKDHKELQEKHKKLESQLEEQSAVVKEHEGCTSRITQLEEQVKEHQSCGDKMYALNTEHLQCAGKITNLENDIKAFQDFKKKFETESSKSSKLQKMHDHLQSELNLTRKAAQEKEEQYAANVNMTGFLAIQMYLADFCAKHNIKVLVEYGPDRLPPGMPVNTPSTAENEGDADETIHVESESESDEESDGGENESDGDEADEDKQEGNPDGENFGVGACGDTNDNGGQDANKVQGQDANQGDKGKSNVTIENKENDDSTFADDFERAIDNSKKPPEFQKFKDGSSSSQQL